MAKVLEDSGDGAGDSTGDGADVRALLGSTDVVLLSPQSRRTARVLTSCTAASRLNQRFLNLCNLYVYVVLLSPQWRRTSRLPNPNKTALLNLCAPSEA